MLELFIVLMGHVSVIQLIILFMSGVTMTSTNCEAAKANTMTGGPDLSFGFP